MSLSPEKLEQLYKIITPQRWLIAPDENSTEAWRNFRTHPQVSRFITDFCQQNKRFFVIHAGRRSFKTETVLRLMVWYASKHEGENLVFAGPTIEHTKGIAWESLKKLVPVWAIKKTSEEGLEIRLLNGSCIRVTGLDVPERIRGRRLNGIVIDEMADIKNNVFFTDIKPGLNDTQGWCIMMGTPKGCQGEFYEVYNRVRTQPEVLEDFGLYHWTTEEIRGAEFVKSDKMTLSKVQFQQENEGLFVQSSGRAYIFSRERHVSEAIPFNPHLPLDISCDFNVHIMPWNISQSSLSMTFVLDEVTGRDVSVEQMCNMVKQKVTGLVGSGYAQMYPLRFYGDSSAQSIRDVAAPKASWSIIHDCFKGWNVEYKLTKRNPSIGDRIAITNARLQTADNKIHCQISPRAHELILDLESISYEDLMGGTKTRLGDERSHASDGFGYLCWYQYKTDYRTQGVRSIPL